MSRIFLFLFFIITLPCLGQTGVIKGTVTNKLNNQPVPYANIQVQNMEKGATSDEKGIYVISNLLPGLYNLEASFVGFEKQTIDLLLMPLLVPATWEQQQRGQ